MTPKSATAPEPLRSILLTLLLVCLPTSAWAQTRVKPPRNFFGVEADVEAGADAAREAERELKLIRDEEVSDYVERVGARLAAALPPEYRHKQFVYSFKVVDDKEQNAFALPGGHVYVNRGLLELTRSEGELAGVMAHEVSHVALRHGTAQATRAMFAEIGLAVLGELLGDGKKSQVAQVGAYISGSLLLLKFSRDYETQADVLGAQIMARAGYDPGDLSRLFRRLEEAGGTSLPRWMSSHPKLRDRADRVGREAAMLAPVARPQRELSEYAQLRDSLRDMPYQGWKRKKSSTAVGSR